MYSLQTGEYGTEYLQRATISFFGLGANRPQDAVYPVAETDSNGQRLSGANQQLCDALRHGARRRRSTASGR